jgi:tripartite-type tricarboxylate transporter receptor subunit TctC
MRRREFVAGSAGVAAAAIIGRATPSGAQAAANWPEKPVKFIVSFAPGGATDLVARPWADALTKAWGQQFVVENRGGASGLIGNEAAFKSAPDGTTFLFTGNTATVGLPLLRKHNFDPRQFIIAAHTGNSISGFVVHPSTGFKTFKELIDYAKKNPGKLNFGSSGAGTQPHLRHEVLRWKAEVDIAHIPYRGGADSLNDLLAGNIQIMNEASTLPHVKAGKLVMLTVNAPERFSEVPDVPTLTEAGYPGIDMSSWFGIYAPPGTPKEIIEKLNAKCNEISKTAEWKATMARVAAVPVVATLPELNKAWDDEVKFTAEVIQRANIKLE